MEGNSDSLFPELFSSKEIVDEHIESSQLCISKEVHILCLSFLTLWLFRAVVATSLVTFGDERIVINAS